MRLNGQEELAVACRYWRIDDINSPFTVQNADNAAVKDICMAVKVSLLIREFLAAAKESATEVADICFMDF